MPVAQAPSGIGGDDRRRAGAVPREVHAQGVDDIGARVQRGRVVGEDGAQSRQQVGGVGGAGEVEGAEALPRLGDARTRRIVELEVGEQVDARIERGELDRAAAIGDDEGLGVVGDQQVEGVVGGAVLPLEGAAGSGETWLLEHRQGQQAARLQALIGPAGTATVEQTDHQARAVDPEPGAAGAQVLSADDPRVGRQLARVDRRPVEELVAIGGHQQRQGGGAAHVDGQGAHGGCASEARRAAQRTPDDRRLYAPDPCGSRNSSNERLHDAGDRTLDTRPRPRREWRQSKELRRAASHSREPACLPASTTSSRASRRSATSATAASPRWSTSPASSRSRSSSRGRPASARPSWPRWSPARSAAT